MSTFKVNQEVNTQYTTQCISRLASPLIVLGPVLSTNELNIVCTVMGPIEHDNKSKLLIQTGKP